MKAIVLSTLVVCLTASATAYSLSHGNPGDHSAPQDTPDDHPSCMKAGTALCPINGKWIDVAGHFACIRPRVMQLPKYCRASAIDIERCLPEMQEHCYRLDWEQTEACMEENIAHMSEECLGSNYFRSLHENAGRKTHAYRAEYDAYAKMDQEHREGPDALHTEHDTYHAGLDGQPAPEITEAPEEPTKGDEM